MAKMVITLVVDADRHSIRKVKERVMYAAHKHIISCSATFLDPPKISKPSESEEPLTAWKELFK